MTPLMAQYHGIKQQYADELVFFQVGDFYELFYDDAVKAAAFLGIVLTQRGTNNGQPIPLCGVPRHAIDHYLIKLVRGGFRVVLCDQLSQPEPGKVVERGVTQVLTPGTLTSDSLLDEKSASYCALVVPSEKGCAVIFIEILTGIVSATVLPAEQIHLFEAELARVMPQEVVLAQTAQASVYYALINQLAIPVTFVSLEQLTQPVDERLLTKVDSLVQDMLQRSLVLTQAFQLLCYYLQKTNAHALDHIMSCSLYAPDNYLMLDAATQRNLELIKNNYDGSRQSTLLAVLDHATTAMGSRMIKRWITQPLMNEQAIERRLEIVATFTQNYMLRSAFMSILKRIGDLERIVGRIALQRAQRVDYLQLIESLKALVDMVSYATHVPALEEYSVFFRHYHAYYQELYTLLGNVLCEDKESEWLVKEGYDSELDRLRGLIKNGSDAVLSLEQREQESTGIQSLKIRFHSSNGYGIEVTKPNLALVPSHYIRLQTLTNRERYTTQELKDLEYDLRHAQQDSQVLEQDLFKKMTQSVMNYTTVLKKTAQYLAEIDALCGFAQSALNYQYVRPEFKNDRNIIISAGRHPVVEQRMLKSGEPFIANDLTAREEERLWIITGPNMGGKSTFLRQNALICIMAQIGSFVPAASAQLSIIDRVFTRIGATDNVGHGKSTFLVEMEETALICQHATEKSLVILDEVGRGTSTYDGLAIAQAVLEYIYTTVRARCLFATHYHELTDLCANHEGIVAYHAASMKTATGIVLLHTIRKGIAEGSFGIEVAKTARIPQDIIVRAQELLQIFAKHEKSVEHAVQPATKIEENVSHKEEYTKLKELLDGIDYDTLSPRQAFDLLWNLKNNTL